MKKSMSVLLFVAIATIVVVSLPAVENACAAALPPGSCVVAQELGWSSWNWNQACYYELQMNCCDPLGDPWYWD